MKSRGWEIGNIVDSPRDSLRRKRFRGIVVAVVEESRRIPSTRPSASLRTFASLQLARIVRSKQFVSREAYLEDGRQRTEDKGISNIEQGILNFEV